MEEIATYDAEEAAETIGITRNKLFRFLRRYNFISGLSHQLSVAPELLYNEVIIMDEKIKYVNAYTVKVFAKKIYFSSKGLIWLKKIYPLLTPKL